MYIGLKLRAQDCSSQHGGRTRTPTVDKINPEALCAETAISAVFAVNERVDEIVGSRNHGETIAGRGASRNSRLSSNLQRYPLPAAHARTEALSLGGFRFPGQDIPVFFGVAEEALNFFSAPLEISGIN